ncbi:MAG: DUF4159 domain-containing protein [candidate division Zixibacteria bacterium]|nr:DUF4159 domain-containing protein [candidate division Zixibacteria bacterium]
MKNSLITAMIVSLLLCGIAFSQNRPILRSGTRLSQFSPDTSPKINPNAISITRLQYSGGGDWYWGNSALPNLLKFIQDETGWPVDTEEKQVKIKDEDLFAHPFLFITGHGTIKLSDSEGERLRQYLLGGGFVFLNDSYGMDKSIRLMITKLFPEQNLQEIPYDHAVYHSFYDFPNGLPKIHEHDNKPATGWGIVIDDRLVLFYAYESDIGDGWEDSQVHNDPAEKRIEALKMGLNIVTYALTN